MNWSRGPTQGLGSLPGVPAIAVLGIIVVISGPAGADVAAGRRAYETGDYALAMAEWQAAADKNDPEAEFGLGQLYEFGAGDLSQDYHRADYWYQKAAREGNVEAEYRLSLIYAAGGDNFPNDLAEAEKWGDLAARSNGVWGGLATDFKKLLDQVATPAQRVNGERRAAAWTEALAAPKPTPQAAQAAGKPDACPGWPFPSLPCTVQFPPLPGVQQPPQPARPSSSEQRAQVLPPKATEVKSPLVELNAELAGMDCVLQARPGADGAAVVKGTVLDSKQQAELVRLTARYFPAGRNVIAVDTVLPPVCRTLVAFNRMKPPGGTGAGELDLRLDNDSNQLHQDQPFGLQVRAPSYPVYLRLDYFGLDGEVWHMKPDGGDPQPKLAARTAGHFFNDAASGKPWMGGDPPFGTELIAAVATPAPLDLGKRQQTEEAADYLPDLEKAFARIGSNSDHPGLVATLLVKTGK